MKVLTQADLRAARLQPGGVFQVPAGTFVTPGAREYLAERGIALKWAEAPEEMRVPKRMPGAYKEAATGRALAEKPEQMTHLRDDLLVPKGHPRIAFRGWLDALEAEVLNLQLLAHGSGCAWLRDDLGQVLAALRQLMAAEVKDEPMAELCLFGLSPAQLRAASHDIRGRFGMGHPVPHYRMGPLALGLNALRTRVRQAELAAVAAYCGPGDERPDLVQAMNRLSSAVYLLFCRTVAEGCGALPAED